LDDGGQSESPLVERDGDARNSSRRQKVRSHGVGRGQNAAEAGFPAPGAQRGRTQRETQALPIRLSQMILVWPTTSINCAR
jgi:hypothetical protein